MSLRERTQPTQPQAITGPVPCGFCSGCEALVPEHTLQPYPRNGGNYPVCAECAPEVRCDCCTQNVPLGLVQIDRDHEVSCNWCNERSGFWPESHFAQGTYDLSQIDSVGRAA